jgi:dipeptidase E
MRLYLSSFRCGCAPHVLRELTGGRVRTALIANADDYKGAGRRATATVEELDRLRDVGLDPREIDLRDYFAAKPGRLEADLRRFDLAWVRGGSGFVLRRALRQSGLDWILPGLISEGHFVYGGYSAGVVVLGLTLRGLEAMDDPLTVPAGYDATPLWGGLGILPYAVVPHFRSPHPSAAAAELAVAYSLERRIPVRTMIDGDVLVIDESGERLLS